MPVCRSIEIRLFLKSTSCKRRERTRMDFPINCLTETPFTSVEGCVQCRSSLWTTSLLAEGMRPWTYSFSFRHDKIHPQYHYVGVGDTLPQVILLIWNAITLSLLCQPIGSLLLVLFTRKGSHTQTHTQVPHQRYLFDEKHK